MVFLPLVKFPQRRLRLLNGQEEEEGGKGVLRSIHALVLLESPDHSMDIVPNRLVG